MVGTPEKAATSITINPPAVFVTSSALADLNHAPPPAASTQFNRLNALDVLFDAVFVSGVHYFYVLFFCSKCVKCQLVNADHGVAVKDELQVYSYHQSLLKLSTYF